MFLDVEFFFQAPWVIHPLESPDACEGIWLAGKNTAVCRCLRFWVMWACLWSLLPRESSTVGAEGYFEVFRSSRPRSVSSNSCGRLLSSSGTERALNLYIYGVTHQLVVVQVLKTEKNETCLTFALVRCEPCLLDVGNARQSGCVIVSGEGSRVQ